MKKYECSIISAGEKVNFSSDIDLYAQLSNAEFLDEHIELDISMSLAETPFWVHYRNNHAETIRYFRQRLYIAYPWDKMKKGNSLIYASYPFIELQRQRNGYVTAHSGAIDLNGKSILLLGKIGAGKTSIAIDLCRRYGAALIGNDITIIGLQDNELCLKGGTKFFTLRYESMKRNLPDLLPFFPKIPNDSWLHKININPADIGVRLKQGRCRIEKVYLVHIDETLPSIFVQKDDSLVTKLFLHENFSRYIRGTCTPMLGGEEMESLGYIPSYDSPKLYEFRRKLMNTVMSKIFYISGPLKVVTDHIASSI